MLDPATGCRAGRATLLRAAQTPLEPLLAPATPGPRRPNESHTTSVGSRKASDEPSAWTEPTPAPRGKKEAHPPGVGTQKAGDEPSAWTEPRQDRSYRQYNKQPMSG